MEGWGGLSGRYPDCRREDETDDGDEPKRLLIAQRDLLLREATALQNKVAGIDMALKLLDEPKAGE